MSCAELVARCLDARTVAHFAHLRTRSYAEHVALGEFYDAIASAADEYVEACMGAEGFIKTYPAITPDPQADIQDYLTDLHAWITKNRDACSCDMPELANLIDEILAVIDRTFYKLKFLK